LHEARIFSVFAGFLLCNCWILRSTGRVLPIFRQQYGQQLTVKNWNIESKFDYF
jgi:hypothetical protein